MIDIENGLMSDPSPKAVLFKKKKKTGRKKLIVLKLTWEKTIPCSAPSVEGSGITNFDSVVSLSTGAKFNKFCDPMHFYPMIEVIIETLGNPDAHITKKKKKKAFVMLLTYSHLVSFLATCY